MRRESDGRMSTSPAHKCASSRKSHFLTKRTNSPIKFRRKQSHIFQLCYTDLCSLHSIPMIFPIKAHLHKRMLDFNGDRVKLDEWRPILKALSLDRSLHLIAIRSKNSCSRVLEHIDSETKSRTVIKLPVLLTSFIFRRLVMSLNRCLSYNSHLKCLELDGLLLTGTYLQTLLVGLEKSSSLQHLSLHRCPLGDEGCRLVCNSLRNLPNILTVDMSGCNISDKGAYFIARALQYQNLNRYGENWKQSLRYRTPDTDVMPGLRRVTLNHNPLIGDTGVGQIISVLRDDLWLKALDLQNVGLTDTAGKEVLELLHVNKSISVLDVHNNPELDKLVFESIMNMLATNNLGKISEYHWIQEDTLYLPRRPLYQSKDPSFVQRPSQDHDPPNQESRLPFDGRTAVRLTKSSIIPRASGTRALLKTRSASAVVERKSSLKALPGHPFGTKQRTSVKLTSSVRQWDHINAQGDADQAPDMRAKLRELSSKLEEETQKRLEAEKQKADLELKLEKLSHDQEGQILMDKMVVKEITEAFAVFNYFVDIISKRGLELETANSSEQLSDHVISDAMSTKSSTLSLRGDFETGVDGDSDGVSILALPLASLRIQERKKKLSKASSASEKSSQTAVTEVDQHSESWQKCKSAEQNLIDQQSIGNELGFMLPRDEVEQSQDHNLPKVPEEIFHRDYSTVQFKDLLKSSTLSFLLNCQNSFSQPFLMNNAVDTSQNEHHSKTDQGSFGLHAESSESLYSSAEPADVNDQEDSWVTESYLSGDSSPCSTLTELNIK